MKNFKKYWPLVLTAVAAFIIGLLAGGGPGSTYQKTPINEFSQETGKAKQTKDAVAQIWTCSMHPQVRRQEPGQCPICAMDLVPVSKDTGQTAETGEPGETDTAAGTVPGTSPVSVLTLSPAAVKLAEIQVQPVERRLISAQVRMVGKVAIDETRVKTITARVPGRIDRLFVDFTGMQVRQGDHLVWLYSPELIAAQQELLQAVAAGSPTAAAVREKLRLWDLTPAQIKEIETSKKTKEHLTINSPISGIVVEKHTVAGTYVNTGTKLYTIADLSEVWMLLDAYESDLGKLRYGQTVTFESEAYPGQFFKGKIAFMDPVLDPQTRTLKMRVHVPNPKFALKPGMFVRAQVNARLSSSGKVVDANLAGKWISPMHPEIVRDHPGTCDICGMPLVKAEEIGYISPAAAEKETPLVIPASAPLITGKRAIVYVSVPGQPGTFAGKEVVLGPRAGAYYIVESGLNEDDQVVSNGAFKIDSDLQIRALPSMMNPARENGGDTRKNGLESAHTEQTEPTGTTGTTGTAKPADRKLKNGESTGSRVPQAFRVSLDTVSAAYFEIQQALSSDNTKAARVAAGKLMEKLALIDAKLLAGSTLEEWTSLQKKVKKSADTIARTGDIEAERVAFDILSQAMTTIVKKFGSGNTVVYRFHCPMAFDNRGAYWLQNHKETRNPYYGAAMLLCKDSIETVAPEKE